MRFVGPELVRSTGSGPELAEGLTAGMDDASDIAREAATKVGPYNSQACTSALQIIVKRNPVD